MRKTLFLWSSIILVVLILILAFENILYVQTYYILFFQLNLSTTVMILLAAVLGFLVGFFAMLYSVELGKLKQAEEDAGQMGSPPAAEPASPSTAADLEGQPEAPESTDEANKPDSFDDDQEVLG